MTAVGIRALKQNASAVVAEAASGKTVTITEHGRPVAQLTPIPASSLERLRAEGRTRAPRRSLADLALPAAGESLAAELEAMREAERY